ncbi:unnamed protein product [Pedinophyceae sp. YPF-701]|nr:unnamed protein product [Pedinophyceae sp. YPF-701]
MEQDSDGNEPVDAFPTPASHPIDIDASGSFDSSGMSGIQPLPAAPGPVDLRGAVLAEGLGTKAVVVLGNGARSVRVHVGIDAPTSLPAQQVLEALASALGAEAFVPGHAAAICAVQHAATRCSGPQDLHAAEWGATASAILTWLGVSGQNLRRSQETDRGGSGRTPFERLVADSARRRGTDATGRAVAALLSNIGLDAQLAGSTRVAAGGRGDARLAAAASTLHALYEAWRIEPLCWRHLPALADLLGSLCAALGWRAHAERYCRDGMAVAVPDRDAKGEPAVADLLEGCRLLAAGRVEAARGVLPPQLAGEGRLSAGDIRKVPTCMRLAVRVVAAYHVLAAQARVAAELRVRRAREGRAASADGADGADAVVLLRRMTEVGWTPGELDRVAAGVALPLRQALWDLKQRPPEGLTPAAYLIIGRDDVAAMAARSTASDGDTVALAWVRSLQAFARPQTERLPVQDADDADDEAVVSADGTPGAAPLQGHARLPPWSHSVVTGVGALRFPRDRRVAEVVALLDSSATRDVFPPSNDADAVQTLLYRTAARTLGLPAGRGAIALHTVRVLPSTVLAAPRLVINVRLPHQNNAIVGPDERTVLANTSRPNVAALLRWAFFSNGVAEGLRASPGGAAGSRSWVALQRVTLTKDAPTEVVLTQAGTLLGLGLSGNLASLSSTDVYTLLSLDQQPTTMATLLGTAASRRGSMDTSFSRMLFLHIPSRHPASYPEIDVVPLTQSAAVLGVGLLFQGSCHRLMSEVLLEEIHPPPWDTPAPPSGAPSGSREGYARSAGLGLGLVLLCSGGRAPGLADLNIESRLRALMTGGVDPSTGAHAATIRKVGQPAKTRRAEDDVCDAARSNMRRVKASSTTLEGDLPALDITCPGATMALALMYHRTNDMRAASWFDPPASAAGLDLVRPDMLQLRTTAWCLVAWDSVGNTPDFIQSRLPPTLKGRLADLLSPPEPGDDIDGLERKLARDGEDLASKTAGHLSMITGLGLGVGLRYAGSGDAQAARTIRGEIEHILDCMRLIHGVTGHALKAGISRYAAEGALATLASALGMIMAGTGDLECVKLLRAMSLRNAKEMTSDHHATLSLALGMLFLGGGSMTLEQSPAATAALAIAFFPDFSSALGSIQRHLYAMAAVPRSVTAIDVDTRLPVQVPISITATSEAASGHDASMAADDQHAALDTHATAPWLLQERSRIQALRTMGPRYLPLVLGDGASIDALFRQRVLLVKRQAGSLPYARDESGMRSLALTARLPRTASPANGHGTVADASLEEACCLFGSDPCLSALARDCTRGFAGAMRGVEPGLFEAMLRRALLEGTEESLTLCLALLSDVTSACDAARRAGDSYLPALVGHVIGVALTHAGMAEVADARHCGPLVPPEVLRHLWDALLAATLEGGAGSALRRWLAGDASGGAAPGAAVTGWMALAGLRSWDGLECALRQADAVGSVAVAAWAVGSGGSVGGGWKLLSALEELRKDPGF